MPRKAVAVTSALLAACAVAALVFVPVLLLELDEAAVPPRAELPILPADVAIIDEEVLCASGGCWRDLTLRGPETDSPEELVGSLRDVLGLSGSTGVAQAEACQARSLLDRRRVCTGVTVRRNEVHLYLQYDRLF